MSTLLHTEYHTFSKEEKAKENVEMKEEVKMVEMIKEEQSDDTPILFLDVNFGEGHVTRIVMYENDTPEELAEAFCQEHNLDQRKKAKLVKIIKKHLESVLEKIEENSEED
jgi:hypothetical protein